MRNFSSLFTSSYCRAILVVSANLVLSCSCAQGSESANDLASPAASPLKVELTTSGRPVAWKYLNEQEWIVDSIGLDIAEILAYAKLHNQAPAKNVSESLEFKGQTIDLGAGIYSYAYAINGAGTVQHKFALKGFIWSPDNYVPLATAIISQLKLAPDSVSVAPPGFLTRLADGEMATLIAENERISKGLSEHPLDAGLHEQASLLLTAFGLQEMAGRFCDTRPNLNRLAAHLALAKALNHGQLSPVGKIADIALENSSWRLSVAVEKITAMEKSAVQPEVAAWLRALKMNATGDYRIFDPKNQTAIEEKQYCYLSSIYNQDESLMPYIEKHHSTMPVEWMRMISATETSVESGHVVLTKLVGAELRAYLNDYNKTNKASESDFKKVITDLNLAPTRAVSSAPAVGINVLPWNTLAAFHCRHILKAVMMEYIFYKKRYAVPELAKQTISRATEYFSKLDQFPFAEAQFVLNPTEKAEFFSRAQAMVVNHPERVASENWDTVNDCVKADKSKPAFVSDGLWFDPAIPMGTAFFFHSRNFLTNYKADLDELTRLKTLCPYSQNLVEKWVLKKYGDNATADQYLQAFGNLVDYIPGVRAIAASAALKDPDKYIALQEETAKKQPSRYFELGTYCVLHDRAELAVKFFEKGIAVRSDDVATSNHSDWLIQYRFDHGQKQKAEELAIFAGDVYSARGLQAQARYFERVGDLKKAEESYHAMMERYNSKHDLTGFFARHSDKDPRFKSESEKQIVEVFPQGLKTAQLSDFKQAPTGGAVITSEDPLCPESPLVKGVVVVAVNGYAVQNTAQFHLARNLPFKPVLTAIVWNGQNYVETKKPVVNGPYFSVVVETYKP